MSDWAVNGVAVLEATISLPRVGNWHADLKLDTGDTTNLTGAVTLSATNGSLTLTGFAYRVGAYTSLVLMRMVGGFGGLARSIASRYYRAGSGTTVTLGNVLADLIRDAGEQSSSSSEAATLNISLPSGRGTGWARQAGVASRALDALMGETDAVWRMGADGKIWVGHDTYPAAASFPYDLISDDKRNGKIVISTDTFSLLPGQSFADPAGLGRNVSYVEITAMPDSVHTDVWYERVGTTD